MKNIADRFYNAQRWFPGYLAHSLNGRKGIDSSRPVKVWVLIADHYEPLWRKADHETAMRRVKLWGEAWPKIAERWRDNSGRPAQYTFFYAQEQYHFDLLSVLAEMAKGGIADVEVHIHHDGEGEKDFVDRMRYFTETLHLKHALLRETDGKLQFAFIHGNWALDNSRPDGRYCGLNNELVLLRQLGCYADFTLPSAPNATQSKMVNTIYYATDDPLKPHSHDRGVAVLPGSPKVGDLLMIPGPLGFNFRGAGRFVPRLEAGELASHDPPVTGRAASWLHLAPSIGNNIFLKLFTHGTQESNSQALLEGGLDRCFEDLATECQKRKYTLHFATAWDLCQAVEIARVSERV